MAFILLAIAFGIACYMVLNQQYAINRDIDFWK